MTLTAHDRERGPVHAPKSTGPQLPAVAPASLTPPLYCLSTPSKRPGLYRHFPRLAQCKHHLPDHRLWTSLRTKRRRIF